jgi:CBS domain-containing protein
MKDKLVRDVMAIGVPACRSDTSVVDVARVLAEEARDILIVMGDQGVEGVVSQSDMARAFLRDYTEMTAGQIMSAGVCSVSPDLPLAAAVETMIEKGYHQVLVADEGGSATPLGVLSKRHLVELMAE